MELHLNYRVAVVKKHWNEFWDDVCRLIFKWSPKRFKQTVIIYLNTEVWAEKGNITPDEVTWKMMLEHFEK